MKSFEQIKDEVAKDHGYSNWKEVEEHDNWTLVQVVAARHAKDYAQQAIKSKLIEAAENNFEQYRLCSDQAQKETEKINVAKMNGLARGYKYAAKQILSLIPKEK